MGEQEKSIFTTSPPTPAQATSLAVPLPPLLLLVVVVGSSLPLLCRFVQTTS